MLSGFTFDPISPPDPVVLAAAAARQNELIKPAGSLGRLEAIGNWAAACQGACPPQLFCQPKVVIFAGDHGIASHGVSAYPAEVTGQMVHAVLEQQAAINAIASVAGAPVRIEDLSVDADTPEHIRQFKVRRGSGSIDVEDALTTEETHQALTAGKTIANTEIDSGTDIFMVGEVGIGNTTVAATLIGVVTEKEPVLVVGRGTGIDDRGWIRKTAAIRDAMWRVRSFRHPIQPIALLQTLAGADLTAMAGFLAQAAVRKTPVLIDGVVVTAAALLAEQLAPGAKNWWLAAHQSSEPAHHFALDYLHMCPILDLHMHLGEGTGAAACLPIVQSALAVLSHMATFEEAHISQT